MTAGIAANRPIAVATSASAIPAVIAYNRVSRDIDRIAIQLATYIEEFSNILQRNAGALPAPPTGTR